MENRFVVPVLVGWLHGLGARTFLLAALVLATVVSGFTKMSEEPKSFSLKDKSQDQVDLKVLPKFDTEHLKEEDRANRKNPQHPGPFRFAVSAQVNFNLNNSGTWQTLQDGRLWRLRIQSPSATNLNLGITRFEVPEGAKLWIYDPGHKHVEGAYTSRNRSPASSLWTPVIEGNEIVIEVFVPTGVAQPVVEISSVNQGYYSIGKAGLFGQSEGTCENDVICPVGAPWSDQIRAVGMYTVNGNVGCTGNLMNDTAHDFKPYILSANHCTVSAANASTIVFYWNFQSATCGTHGPGSLADNQTGAIYHASWALSDFVLFELNANPDPSYKVYYAGWDATGTASPGVVGIHHPSLDVKAISFSNTSPQSADWTGTGDGGTLDPSGNHWHVDWDSGVTEEGSSGSCIFETNTKRCIGQLHGGPSACGSPIPGPTEHDYYGKFAASWNGGGTSDTRLKDWLDPGNTGTLNLDGDPHIITANGVHYDFQGAGEFISLRDPDGLEIQTRQTPIATTFNPGPDAHDGLATCVSLNSAVAAHVGKHRITYEPNLSGVPDPSGLQLRVDGALKTLGASGIDFGDGGRLALTSVPGGLEVDFLDSSVLYVTPSWWASQSKWYLNVDIVRPTVTDGGSPGGFPTGGIAGTIAGDDWLPRLPDGSSMGAMPGPLHQRYVDLYQKFADAWRVTDKSSLFDYAPGTSTDTFTMKNWPLENPPCVLPGTKPVPAGNQRMAEEACQPVPGGQSHNNCIFDVMVTNNPGFARTYVLSQRILTDGTRTTVTDNKNPTGADEPVIFTASVTRNAVADAKGVATGTVQFMVDHHKEGKPIRLDGQGQAKWKTAKFRHGKHEISASYTPSRGSAFLPSSSPIFIHIVKGGDSHHDHDRD